MDPQTIDILEAEKGMCQQAVIQNLNDLFNKGGRQELAECRDMADRLSKEINK